MALPVSHRGGGHRGGTGACRGSNSSAALAGQERWRTLATAARVGVQSGPRREAAAGHRRPGGQRSGVSGIPHHMPATVAGRWSDAANAARHGGTVVCNVAEVQHARGDLTGAAAAYGEAVELCRRLMELVGEAPQAQQDLVGALDGLGRVTRRIGDLARSRAAHEEALTLYRRLIAKTGPSPSRDRQLAALLNNAGNGLLEGGDHAGAREAFEEAVTLNRRSLGTTGETLSTLRDLSMSLNGLGNVHLEEHNFRLPDLSRNRMTRRAANRRPSGRPA